MAMAMAICYFISNDMVGNTAHYIVLVFFQSSLRPTNQSTSPYSCPALFTIYVYMPKTHSNKKASFQRK
jgi:hypothetical protein